MKTAGLLLPIVIIATVFVAPSMATAHDAFKEPMEKKYGFKTVSCKTCHPDNKDRTINNDFGKYFLEELKGKDISKKFKEAEAKGEEAVAEYEKEMVVHFLEALKVVEKKKITFEDLLKAGLLNGTRLDTKKKE